jgi:dynein intermediate chain 4, axonemal
MTLRSKIAVEPKPKPIIVRDANGEDVTPMAFYSRNGKDPNASGIDISTRETVSDLLNHLDTLGGTSFSEASIQKSSAFGDSQALSQQESIGDDNSSRHASYYEESIRRDSVLRNKGSAVPLPTIAKELDQNKPIHIQLTETKTVFLLSIPSVCVSAENLDECTLVRAQNAKYKELKSIIPNNDNYVSRGMQTLSKPVKTKDVQAVGQKVCHAEVMVNEWAIYDEYHQEDAVMATDLKEIDLDSKLKLLDSGTVTQTSSTNASTFSISHSIDTVADVRVSVHLNTKSSATSTATQLVQVETTNPVTNTVNAAILQSATLLDKLNLVEKAIVGNSYAKKVIMYRNVPDDALIEQKRIDSLHQTNEDVDQVILKQRHTEDFTINTLPTLQALWTYKCELTRGRQVNYLTFNKQNEDIVAVAYSESRLIPTAPPGLILCWSAKNPEWPDKIYYSQSPVTSLDFSRLNPGLLAAGFVDGRIAIYDVRQNSNVPVMDDRYSFIITEQQMVSTEIQFGN